MASQLTVWHNLSSHTQTAIQKQPKPKKQQIQSLKCSVQFQDNDTTTKGNIHSSQKHLKFDLK